MPREVIWTDPIYRFLFEMPRQKFGPYRQGLRNDEEYKSASSGKRVGDFEPFLNCCLFVVVAVGMWATRLRCPHVHSEEVVSSRVFVIGPWSPIK